MGGSDDGTATRLGWMQANRPSGSATHSTSAGTFYTVQTSAQATAITLSDSKIRWATFEVELSEEEIVVRHRHVSSGNVEWGIPTPKELLALMRNAPLTVSVGSNSAH